MAPTTNQPASDLAAAHPLAGQNIVVVGGKTGIGLGVAHAARAAGATVVLASRRIASLEERPDLAAFAQVSLDMRNEASVRAAFDTIGALDHLIVSAAPDLGTWGSFMDADMSGVRSYVEGKFLGSWACARHSAPHLRPGGSITFLTGGTLIVEKCTINNFTNQGIDVSAPGTTIVSVKDTMIRNNAAAGGLGGVRVHPSSSGTSFTTLDNVRLERNQIGLRAEAGATVIMRNSTAFRSLANGITILGGEVDLDGSNISANVGNGVGVISGTLKTANSSFFKNASNISGTFTSLGGNHSDGSGTPAAGPF